METLVKEEQKGTLHETNSPKYFTNLKDPADVMGVRATLSDRRVQSRSNNQDGHLEREKMSLKKSVSKEECSLPVGFFNCLRNNFRVDAAFERLFRVRVKMILDIGIIRVFPITY